jgi:hypothetical protein
MDDIEIGPVQSGYSALRRWVRYAAAMPVRVRVPRLIGARTLAAWGLQLNCGGLTVYGIEYYGLNPAVGSQVEVEFLSPSSGQLRKMWCVVLNRGDRRHGLEFLVEDEFD